MSQWQNVTFQIVKQTDASLVSALRAALADVDQTWDIASLQLEAGPVLQASPSSIDENEEIRAVLALKGAALKMVTITFTYPAKPQVTLQVQRNSADTTDTVTVHLQAWQNQGSDPKTIAHAGLLVHHLKERLGSVDTQKGLQQLLPKEVRKHFQARENELQRLEGLSETLVESLTQGIALTRAELEGEFSERRTQLQSAISEEEARLKETYTRKAEELAQRESAFEARLKEIDDRDSRHVRRQIRESLKQELQRSTEKFELTQGTQGLRKPIHAFVWVLLLLFGAGMVGTAYAGLQALIIEGALSTLEIVKLSVSQVAFTLAFGSTAVFYVRWNNRWFEQHATEEFRLKRLNLDLDRASWVVEMAMEWEKEKGTEIPDVLLERLTSNLFEADHPHEAPLHPADQLASALLGASAEAQVALPGGGHVRLDRKSLERLRKKPPEKVPDPGS